MGQNGRVRVVIVDDMAIFRDAARQCLTARGYHVVAEVGGAAGAVEAVQRHEPDAMLVDVHLGDDDGFAVCDAVTRLRPHLAVVLTSAEDCQHLPERIESCGARGFHPKAASGPRRFGPILAVCLSFPARQRTSSLLLRGTCDSDGYPFAAAATRRKRKWRSRTPARRPPCALQVISGAFRRT
jgi:CheY-like chemotaxis protein